MFSFQRGSIAGPPLQLCDKDCPQVSPVPSRVFWEMKCLDHLFHYICLFRWGRRNHTCHSAHTESVFSWSSCSGVGAFTGQPFHKSVLMQLFKPIPHVINTNYIPKHICKMAAHLETLENHIKNCSPVLSHSSLPKSSNANIHRMFSAQLQCPLSVWSLWNLYHQCY